MFQRLKGAIDSKIAEEQARARLSNSSPSRSSSQDNRRPPRAATPTRRPPKQGAQGKQDGDVPATDPDPGDFDPEFVIGEDELSRSGTPRPPTTQDGSNPAERSTEATLTSGGSHETPDEVISAEGSKALELPTDVRVKLRKLEKLESRYHELLTSYRIAHARVLTIDPFETCLREYTPLTSITDPNALVEYLNQVNLKGDMVLEELKRVSCQRDSFKQRLNEAEKSTKEAWDEVTNLRGRVKSQGDHEDSRGQMNGTRSQDDDELQGLGISEEDPPGAAPKSPPTSVRSPTVSIRGLSLFSPKAKSLELPKARQGSEDIFSYDGEIPRLESEVRTKQEKINELEHEMNALKGDLAVTRESTQSMVQTLEEATREVNILRDCKDRSESDMKRQKASAEMVSEQLRVDVRAAEEKLLQLRVDTTSRDTSRIRELESQLKEVKRELKSAQSTAETTAEETKKASELQLTVESLETEIKEFRAKPDQNEKKLNTLNSLVATLRSQFTDSEASNKDLTIQIAKSSQACEALQQKVGDGNAATRTRKQQDGSSQDMPNQNSQSFAHEPVIVQDTATGSKKKNKKKKKGANPCFEPDRENQAKVKGDTAANTEGLEEIKEPDTIKRLQEKLKHLQTLLEEKDVDIDRVHRKLKDQEGLQEEIDTLRDDLINVGQEHVHAKDNVKELVAEKSALESTIYELEKELADLRSAHASSAQGSEQKHNDLTAQFEDLKQKATTLQIDLSAAQQLASTRFKDLNDLRSILQKAQPEINSLRSGAAELKLVKETLGKRDTEFKRLNSGHEEMRSEVAGLKQMMVARDGQISNSNEQNRNLKILNEKTQEEKLKLSKDIHNLQVTTGKQQESLDRVSKDLTKSQDELSAEKSRVQNLEQQLSKIRIDNQGWREEVELKSAQYDSAQSLMASMRDQTAEMAMQIKEARERCEDLDEELADARRLLGERSREGETMRRLLADVEGRADARTREMKERMDTAIEERDCAEDEASTAGRRRARELEDLRNKYRDVERNLKRAEEDKGELEKAQRDWKKRREELENMAGQSTHEVDEVRRAMGELQDVLDASEKQARELEKQKAELRRSVEDTQHRMERLQKSNKSLADELSKIQTARTKAMASEGHSSRTSVDSTTHVGSPAPKSRKPSAALVDPPNGQAPSSMDYVYLKNVLLQFLEQKDRKHQMQLIPVLGMLLHFDRKDEEKWMSAITTK